MTATLTAAELEVLKRMRDEDEELVYGKGIGYVGFRKVNRRTLLALLRAMAIKLDQFSEVGKYECYMITETGRRLLEEAGS